MATVTFSLEARVRSFIDNIRKARWELADLEDSGDRASRATAKLGKSSKTTTTLLQSFKEAAEGVGGKTGESAGKIEKFGKAIVGVGRAAGPAGIATLGLVGGVAAFGAAAALAAVKTSKWIEELKKAGKEVPVSEQGLKDIETMDKSIKELTLSMKQLGVIIGTSVAPIVEGFVVLLDDGVHAARSIMDQLDRSPTIVKKLGEAFGLLTGIGGSPVWKALVGEGRNLSGRKLALADTSQTGSVLEDDDRAMLAPTRKEDKDYGKRVAKQIDEVGKAAEKLQQFIQGVEDQLLSQFELEKVQHERRIAQIKEWGQTSKNAADAQKALDLEEKLRRQELLDYFEEQSEKHAAAQEKIRAENERTRAEEKRQHEEALAEAKALSRQRTDLYIAAADAAISAAMTVADISTRKDGEMTESQRRAAKRAFRVNQVLAIAQTVMSTSAGMIRAFQDIPYPASIAAAAQIGIQGTAQTAVIAAQRPSFATGGVMDADHRPALLQPGEGVLTRAGVHNVGGAAGIDAINEGRGAGGPVQAVVQFDHRWFDRGARQNVQRGGSISRAINRRTKPIGHTEYRR